ncbi:MAG TPA: alpha/beta fold hydrolase [Candidatus Thermoplasmatota archaeon]|nr:alpha/beta fold hydrolase [Candidatus Thermoplasmatota archaeon]
MASPPEPSPTHRSACVRVGRDLATYLEAGPSKAREAVVLLHGFGAWAEVTWTPTLAALAPDHRVLAPDMLGFGLTSKPDPSLLEGDDATSVEVAFLERFLDAVGVERATLVGASFGGALALRLARAAGDRVDRLVLVGSMGLGRAIHPLYRALGSPLLGERLSSVDRAGVERLWKLAVDDPARVTPALLDRHLELLSEPGALVAIEALRLEVDALGQRHPQTRALPFVPQPTLLVWGARDRVFPLRHAFRAARRMPRAAVAVVPGCGHLPPIERPDRFNAILADFLARGLPPPKPPAPRPAETPRGRPKAFSSGPA